MKIGTCISRRGEIAEGFLSLVTLQHGESVQIPVKIAQGTKPGKCVFISAGMHGDEINGVELLRRFYHNFIEHNHIKDLKGTIIFLPILNPSGFMERKRHVVFDKKDLNRCFNVTKQRTISNEIADTIMEEVIAKCDYGLDFHDSGGQNVLLPHPRVHIEKTTGCTSEMGSLFGADIITERKGEDGMMAVEMHKKFGIPIVTFEVGGAGVIWDHFLDRSVVGIRNILVHFGFLSGQIILPEKQFIINLEDDRRGYRAPFQGLVNVKVHLGDPVEKDDLLFRLYDPLSGQEEEVRAKTCGVVFSRRMRAKVKKNSTIVSLLEFEKCPMNNRRPVVAAANMIVNESTDKIQVVESEVFLRALGLRV